MDTFPVTKYLTNFLLLKLSLGVAELAVVVYDALDWELSFERKLSSDLEEVIDLMTSADDMEQHDEGISIGDEDMNSDLSQKIFGYCCKHHNTVSLIVLRFKTRTTK